MEFNRVAIGVKMTRTDEELLRKVCEDRGENLSSFVRRAVKRELASLSYFDEDVKKSLGIVTVPVKGPLEEKG